MPRSVSVAIIMFTTQLVAVQAAPNDSIVTTMETYPIQGRTIAELRSAVIEASTILGNGAHGAASATFRFDPELQYVDDGYSCTLGSIDVRLTAIVTLPEWISSKGADEEAVAAWRRFLRYVRAHEERHVAIAADYRLKMVQGLASIGARSDCPTVGREAVSVVTAIENEHDEAQTEFDRNERDRSSLLGR